MPPPFPRLAGLCGRLTLHLGTDGWVGLRSLLITYGFDFVIEDLPITKHVLKSLFGTVAESVVKKFPPEYEALVVLIMVQKGVLKEFSFVLCPFDL